MYVSTCSKASTCIYMYIIYIYIYIYEKNYRTVRDGGNPTKMAVATNNIMQVMNIILKLLVIESKIEHLQ